MARSATDLAAQISELTEDLTAAAKTEVRQDIAAELTDMVQGGEDKFRAFLTATDGPSYLPGTDPAEWVATPDFYAGVRFVIAALKDKGFEF